MVFKNDMVAYDAAGRLALAVEVRNKRGSDNQWAAATRQLLLENGYANAAPYFLLALPDRLYLWVDKHQSDLVEPDYSIDPLPFLKPYLGTPYVPEHLSNIAFEMVVEAWLASLTWTGELPANVAENGNWLIESGLLDALKNGWLAYEVTA